MAGLNSLIRSEVTNAQLLPLSRLTVHDLRRPLVSTLTKRRRCEMNLSIRSVASLTFLCFAWNPSLAQSDSAAPASQNTASTQAETEASDTLTFRTTVRRVIVDVVVRDSNNKPVHGLTASDFFIFEDGHPQSLLAFDVHNFDTPSISLPANSPHLAVNSFVNIPIVPEHGPLYVILYDLVNMEDDDQIDARRQILKFIKSKPAGTRFAIYVRTDGLYLVQGFTADNILSRTG